MPPHCVEVGGWRDGGRKVHAAYVPGVGPAKRQVLSHFMQLPLGRKYILAR